MRLILILFLLLSSHSVLAFELFGVAINSINRVQLRDAIRNGGAEVVREAGDDNWYDVYDMSVNFKQSKQLFVAYEKVSGNFAFAEYHLPYGYFNTMLLRLKAKYGKPTIEYGKFQSDAKFTWNVDGIDIMLKQDWNNNLSQLIYSKKEQLGIVQQAYRKSEAVKRSELLQLSASYY